MAQATNSRGAYYNPHCMTYRRPIDWRTRCWVYAQNDPQGGKRWYIETVGSGPRVLGPQELEFGAFRPLNIEECGSTDPITIMTLPVQPQISTRRELTRLSDGRQVILPRVAFFAWTGDIMTTKLYYVLGQGNGDIYLHSRFPGLFPSKLLQTSRIGGMDHFCEYALEDKRSDYMDDGGKPVAVVLQPPLAAPQP